mmetsp:Transcript_5244/g.14124  ORF Transcript_5244/g.14124 Transcript_5244/m.14124 type:complete len:201 (-) Transcript_5244:788-1390(-)
MQPCSKKMDGSGSSAGGGSPACRGSSNACEVACCTLLLFCPPPSISVPFLFAALASTGFSCSTALLLPPPTNPSPTKLPPSAQVTPATPACCSKDTLFACLLVAACLCWALGADPPPPLPFHCSMLQGGCSPNRLGGPKREGESGGTAAKHSGPCWTGSTSCPSLCLQSTECRLHWPLGCTGSQPGLFSRLPLLLIGNDC